VSTPGGANFERRAADWLPFAEARTRVLGAARTLDAERVSVPEAVGRALSDTVSATATLPPWDNSAMDGYAVRSTDVQDASATTPARLRMAGVVRAGQPTGAAVGVGEAVRIMTGAPLPPGADAVVRVEDTDAEAVEGSVEIRASVAAGRNIRPAGRDMQAGALLLETGHTIRPGTVGLLAAAGVAEVSVTRRPTVAIITTGDELRTVDEYGDVRSGRGIPDSNGPMVASMVRAAGGEPVLLGIASDDRDELKGLVEAGRQHDVLVTVGGASMGDADLVKRVLDDVGFRQDFWRVKMRPGSPFGFGFLPAEPRERSVFGLPGNPASAFVTFELFVRPFLLAIAGHRRVLRPEIVCRSAETVETPAALTHFHRVALEDGSNGTVARLTGAQGSGLVSGLAHADGLAVIAEHVERTDVGGPLRVMLLDSARAVAPVRQ
jgi:molybdopterin molybdotransferase